MNGGAFEFILGGEGRLHYWVFAVLGYKKNPKFDTPKTRRKLCFQSCELAESGAEGEYSGGFCIQT